MKYKCNEELMDRLHDKFFYQPVRRDLTEMFLRRICRKYRVGIEDLRSDSRKTEFVEPRHISFYILHRLYRIPCEEVGDLLNRDHSTVTHACRKMEGFIEISKKYEELVIKLATFKDFKI